MQGSWIVYCCGTFDGTRWQKEFQTEREAFAYAKETGGNMLTCHIDNPNGKLVGKTGTF